ncbi:MAG: sialidase family protein [Candidatus Dormibacteria bacterium]
MHVKRRLVLATAAVPLIVGGAFVANRGGPTAVHAYNPTNGPQIQQKILSGFADYELRGESSGDNSGNQPANYQPRGSDECSLVSSSNVKVNQNCLNISDPDLQGRAQAQNETSIAEDPYNPSNIIASYNDYRRGDGNCYGAYSTDSGRTWNDTTIPMSFTRGTAFGQAARQYWQAGGDTSVAWDTKGNAYFDCQVFQRGRPTTPNADLSSAVYLFRSTGNEGASWNFPGRPVVESSDLTGSGVPPFEDKPYMTVDNHVGSPFQDRVYVTWTEFRSDGSAYILESYSNDYGEHFNGPHLVSITSTQLCPNTFGAGTSQGQCNENQFSDPFTGPDGALYVAFNNFNNQASSGNDNKYQVLLARSTDGGNTFTTLTQVSDYYDLPDCATYQAGKDAGRSCVPEKGASTNSYFRATNYPSGQVNPANTSQVVVTFGSYINQFSKETNGCAPTGFSPFGNPTYTGVKTAGACNNKILYSVSNDAGTTFSGTAADPRTEPSVNSDAGQATTDQFWQWSAFNKNGKLAVSYYDREYGSDETTGFSDVSLSGSKSLTNWGVLRVTSVSNPPPTQFSGVFLGDYNAVTAVTNAQPLWMDTRDPDLFICPNTATAGTPPAVCTGSASNASVANDQDAFTANVAIPGN